ncbi:hypothetical protein [Bacteroides heparinolyticus]|uniref:hypothetical protein n=1 Tax=Prevotella heparinolytica TaxID=28113 RepID=UPI00359F7AD8
MTEVYLIEGIKGSGKSKRIHTLKEKYIKAGYKLTDSKNEKDWNTAMFVLEKEGQKIILNSGSDMKSIIVGFETFLSSHKDATEVYTAIRPQQNNPRLNKWMKDALSILNIKSEKVYYLPEES